MSLEREITEMIIEALNIEDISLDDIDAELALRREGLFIDSLDTTEARSEHLKLAH